MLTNIVVLYLAYALNLPKWCGIVLYISLAIQFMQLGCGLYKGLTKD